MAIEQRPIRDTGVTVSEIGFDVLKNVMPRS